MIDNSGAIVIHPDDPTYVRIARNNRRLKYWTVAIITFLATLNVLAMFFGGI